MLSPENLCGQITGVQSSHEVHVDCPQVRLDKLDILRRRVAKECRFEDTSIGEDVIYTLQLVYGKFKQPHLLVPVFNVHLEEERRAKGMVISQGTVGQD